MLDIWLARISVSAMPWEAPQNEHRCHQHVFATAGGRDLLPLCVRCVLQSESIPVCLFYPVGLLCADHRDRQSIFLPIGCLERTSMLIQSQSGNVANADGSSSPSHAPNTKVYALQNDLLIGTVNRAVGVVPRYRNLEGTATAP